MDRRIVAITLLTATLTVAPAALGATDYLLEIDAVTGESSVSGEVLSWSLGASNPTSVGSSGMSAGRITAPRDAASGQATGRRTYAPAVHVTASQNTQSLRNQPGGTGDLLSISRQSEVQGFTLHFDKASPVLARVCSGKHFGNVQLRGRGEAFALENVVVTQCDETAMPAGGSPAIARQTQGSSFGERCRAGLCTATGNVAVTITGQMKHNKTGHVTLMK